MWVVGKILNPMVGSWNSSYAVIHMNHMDLLFFIFREINVEINGTKIKYENKERPKFYVKNPCREKKKKKTMGKGEKLHYEYENSQKENKL